MGNISVSQAASCLYRRTCTTPSVSYTVRIDSDATLEISGSTQPVSLFSILDKIKMDANPDDISAVKMLLIRDPPSVNEVRNGLQPLHQVLASSYCSVELVKLLVDHGAALNVSGWCQFPSMLFAYVFGRSSDIVKVLLDGGADIDVFKLHGVYLWTVLHTYHQNVYASHRLLNLLRYHSCEVHKSLLDCYIHTAPFLMERTIKLLLDRKDDATRKNDYHGSSALCRALEKRSCTVQIVRLLVGAGNHVKKCDLHEFPLHCYVTRSYHRSADIVKLLLDETIDLNQILSGGYALLHLALFVHGNKADDVELLLNQKNVDFHVKTQSNRHNYIRSGYPSGESSLLHCELLNPGCNFNVVRLLLEKGARPNDANVRGELPLHYAIKNKHCNIDIVRILIKYGSQIDKISNASQAPLRLALALGRDPDIVKLLLAAGVQCSSGDLFVAIKKAPTNCIRAENLKRVELLIMHCLLQSNFVHLKKWFQGSQLSYYIHLTEKYVFEIHRMQSKYVAPHCSLWKFVSEFPYAGRIPSLCNVEAKDYNLDKLLAMLVNDHFPLFFYVISTKVERSKMFPKFCNLKMCLALNGNNIPGCFETEVTINHDCVVKIASLLPDSDLFSFLVASLL